MSQFWVLIKPCNCFTAQFEELPKNMIGPFLLNMDNYHNEIKSFLKFQKHFLSYIYIYIYIYIYTTRHKKFLLCLHEKLSIINHPSQNTLLKKFRNIIQMPTREQTSTFILWPIHVIYLHNHHPPYHHHLHH